MKQDKDLMFLASCQNDDLRALCDILTYNNKGEIRMSEQLTDTDAYLNCYPDKMNLMAAEQGVGSCWVQIHLRSKDGRDSEEIVRDILKIDDHYRIVGIMALGHSDDIPKAHTLDDIDRTKVHFLV